MNRPTRRRMKKPVPLSSVLGDYLKATGLDASIDRIVVLEEWSAIVGHRIAQVTRATEVRGDSLLVEVDSSAWLSELTMMRSEILERVNRSTKGPPFRRILFRLAGIGRSRAIAAGDQGTP